jgi:hypothetical protein
VEDVGGTNTVVEMRRIRNISSIANKVAGAKLRNTMSLSYQGGEVNVARGSSLISSTE